MQRSLARRRLVRRCLTGRALIVSELLSRGERSVKGGAHTKLSSSCLHESRIGVLPHGGGFTFNYLPPMHERSDHRFSGLLVGARVRPEGNYICPFHDKQFWTNNEGVPVLTERFK